MIENKNNARYQATHDKLKETYKDLLMTSKDGRVSVSKIVAQAKVNRKTFYIHFEVIEDLIEEIADDLAEKMVLECQKINFSEQENFFPKLYHTFFSSMVDEIDFHQFVITDRKAFFIYQDMMRLFTDKMAAFYSDKLDLDDQRLELMIAYVSSGFMMLYRKWLFSGKQLTEAELMAFSDQLLKHGLLETIEIFKEHNESI